MMKLEGNRLSGEEVPLGPGTLSGSSRGGGPRLPAGVVPPTTSFGQLRWALGPGAQEPSAPLPQRAGLERGTKFCLATPPPRSQSGFCLIDATGHSSVLLPLVFPKSGTKDSRRFFLQESARRCPRPWGSSHLLKKVQACGHLSLRHPWTCCHPAFCCTLDKGYIRT